MKNRRKLNIGIGTVSINSEAKKSISGILDSNRLSYGYFTKKFESEIAKIHGRKYAIFINSGTSALYVSLQVLKDKYNWQEGDEILVPSVTFIATSNVVLHNNLNPVFVDVERDYFGMDPAKIEAKVSKKTRAIMPVHLFGQSADMEPILKIAQKYKLKIVEDSCETMFVQHKGKPVGSLGDIACFSTYATHLVVTGVGGIVMTDDADLAVRIKSYCNHGRDGIYLSIDDDDKKGPAELFKIVDKKFSFVHLRHSFRIKELEAAIGLSQLGNWKKIISKRQRNAYILSKGLLKWLHFLQTPKVRPDSEHAFMLYPLIITNMKVNREKLVRHLELRGIETRYMMPLLSQPIYRKIFGNIIKNFPVADYLDRNAFIIGCHQDLTREEIHYIVGAFDDFFKNY